MPRAIPAALATHIALGATSLCELIKITPVVGTVLAFTSHTSNLTVDSVTYLARPGMRMSVVKSNVRMEVDNSEGAGFFQTGVITLADILRGKFNDALFERRFCNYDSVGDGGYTFQSGYIGRAVVQDNVFQAEFRSLLAVLSQPVGLIVSRRCNVRRVGDARCKFDLTQLQSGGSNAPFRQSLTVSSVINQITIHVNSGYDIGEPGNGDADWFRGGVITWLTGNNAGYESEIAYSDATSGLDIGLMNAAGQDIQAGDTFYAYAGCDRSYAHCFGKFRSLVALNGNLVNFRGFPYLIGDDLYRAADALYYRPPPSEL